MKKKIKKPNKGTRSATQSKGAADAAVNVRSSGATRVAQVDYEAFVKLWTKAESVGAVAAAFNIKATSASAIANRLRKKGVVDLKRFPRRGARVIDVKKLNKIAAGKD